MNDQNIILDPTEENFRNVIANINQLKDATRKAITEQELIARRAEATIARLELQLESLETFGCINY